MTIFKNQQAEKKPESEQPLAEVVFEIPLAKKKDAEAVAAPEAVAVTVTRRRRFSACACILLLCTIIAGTVGGIFLYKHFAYRHNRTYGWCGTTFYDEQFRGRENDFIDPEKLIQGTPTTEKPQRPIEINEEVDVDVDNQVETFHIPKVGPYRPIQVVYDFQKNLTAILDKEQAACFVKPLNRSLVQPPRTMLDLLLKMRSNYYLKNSKVSRQFYTLERPAVEDTTQFGIYIDEMCSGLPTFRLKKIYAMPTPMAMQDDHHKKHDDHEEHGSHSSEEHDDDEEHHHGGHGHNHHGHHHKHGRHGAQEPDRKRRDVSGSTCHAVFTGAYVEETCIDA